MKEFSFELFAEKAFMLIACIFVAIWLTFLAFEYPLGFAIVAAAGLIAAAIFFRPATHETKHSTYIGTFEGISKEDAERLVQVLDKYAK